VIPLDDSIFATERGSGGFVHVRYALKAEVESGYWHSAD
jgi:hypothetical protein